MNNYSREEVFKSTLEYFNGDTFATDVWINKYSLKEVDNNTNEIIFHELNPNDMFKRIANEILRIEEKYKINKLTKEEILELIKDFKYIIPQGGSLSGIGNNYQTISLSNCFVIGSDLDSYGSIFQTDQEQVQLMKRRGGVGHDLSALRPKGTKVNNSALTSSGIVPFMDRYSNSTKEVAQDGRRGALMLSIDITHPQAEDFIDAKLTEGKITAANISVKLTDEFMNAVFSDKKFIQQFPVNSQNPKIKKEIDPKQIWKKIIYNAWKSAEPGVLFWDQIIRESVADCYNDFKTVSTNPCVVGDTLVLTNVGWVKIKNLSKYKNVKIITQDKTGKLYNSKLTWSGITTKLDSLFKINLSNGEFLLVNKSHKFYQSDFSEICVDNIKPNQQILGAGNFLLTITSIEKLNKNEDVYDLTAIPNYNFFSILNRSEYIIEDKIIINDNIEFNYFDIVNVENGQKFAYELNENDVIK